MHNQQESKNLQSHIKQIIKTYAIYCRANSSLPETILVRQSGRSVLIPQKTMEMKANLQTCMDLHCHLGPIPVHSR